MNAMDLYGRTPISYAALSGHEEAVRMLASLPEVDVNVVDEDDRTPLLGALANGHLATANELMALERVAVDRNKLLMWLAARDRLSGFNMLTCDGKMDSELSNGLGHTVLSIAAHCGSINVLKALIDRGDIELNVRDKQGMSPIRLAALNGNMAAVEALLSSGRFRPNKDVENGKMPFSFVSEEDESGPFKWTSEPTTSCIEKEIALFRLGSIITVTGNVADFKHLLEPFEVFDVNEKIAQTGRTLVSLAAQYGRAEIIELLVLWRGADIRSRDSTGQTPMSLAIMKGHFKVFQFLFGQLHPGKRCRSLSPESSARKNFCRAENDSV